MDGPVTCDRQDIPLVDEDIPIVIFDLDDTLAQSVWPSRRAVGPPIAEGVELLKHYAGLGFRVEIYTSRPKVDSLDIWDWVEQNDLPVDAVTCEKPFGGLYIDDRSWRPPYALPWRDFTVEVSKKKKKGRH